MTTWSAWCVITPVAVDPAARATSGRGEGVCRLKITDGVMLADEAEHYRRTFDTIRPHEALDMHRPTDAYLTADPNFEPPNLSQNP